MIMYYSFPQLKAFILLTAVLTGSLFTQVAIADDDRSGFLVQIRVGLTQTKDGAGADDKTTAIGGSLGYLSPSIRSFNAGGKVYVTQPVGNDEDGLFLGSDGNGYMILGEVWGQVTFAHTRIKAGRQAIDTPFADTDDTGMIPNTFQGVVLRNTALVNTTFIVSHLDKWAGVDTEVPEKFTDMNGSKGVNVLGVMYEQDKWTGQLWHYKQKQATDISYAELGLSPIENLGIGLQYITQKDNAAGGTGQAWGVSAHYSLGDFVLSADMNKVSGANAVINGFGGGPYFTSSENNTIDGVVGIRANAVGVEYSGIKNLTLAARKVNFDKGVSDELDMTASYEIRDHLTADLIISDMGDDAKNNRLFINYDIDL